MTQRAGRNEEGDVDARGVRTAALTPARNMAVARAARILAAFDEETPTWTVSDLSRHLGVAKSSVSTVLATLSAFDLVAKPGDGGGRYSLGLRCIEMGYLSSARLRVRDLAFPLLERLLDEAQQIVYLAIPYQSEVLYVEAMYPPNRRINYSSQGRRAPLYCTGIGKALLAYLPDRDRDAYLERAPFPRLTPTTLCGRAELEAEIERIRACGFAMDREEREHGIRCVAAPVLSPQGDAIAAVSVSGSSDQIDEDRVPELAQNVIAAAMDIRRKMQFAGHGGGP